VFSPQKDANTSGFSTHTFNPISASSSRYLVFINVLHDGILPALKIFVGGFFFKAGYAWIRQIRVGTQLILDADPTFFFFMIQVFR
jgi:hypothetical protein